MHRSRNKSISEFKVNGKGIRRTEHPTSFQKIFLTYTINSKDTENKHIQEAIQLSEDKFCPVWAMVKNNVEVVTEYKIIRLITPYHIKEVSDES